MDELYFIPRSNFLNHMTTNMAESLLIIITFQFLAIRSELINDPTLKPSQCFSASEDAEKIRQEICSFTPDRDEISRIIFHRPYDQRRQIDEYYNQKFCTDPKSDHCPLHSALKDVSIENMDELYNVVLTPPEGILAKVIFDSIEGTNDEVGAIEEVVCANDKEMKDLINKYYQTNYQKTVEDHLATFKTDMKDYQNAIINYCWRGLCQEKKISSQDVDNEAQILQDINHKEDKKGFKNKLIELLGKYCAPDLKLIFEKYCHDDKHIGDAVNMAFEVEQEARAFNTLVRYIENSCKFYAEQLESSLNKITVLIIHYNKINRIILTRCERDLLCILKEYENEHHKTFTKSIKDKYDGRYITYGIWPEMRYLTSIRYLCGKP